MKTLVKHEAPEMTFLTNGHHAPAQKAPKAYTRKVVAWWLLFAAGFGFIGAGAYTFFRGLDARDQVKAEFVSQRITTPEDASIPNAMVKDAATAQSQADVIRKHYLEATGGKTYSELERTDPARATALNGSLLRGSLLTGVLAWNVATLVIGIGAFMAAIGALLVIGLVFFRPSKSAS
jgi:hypothetical protein